CCTCLNSPDHKHLIPYHSPALLHNDTSPIDIYSLSLHDALPILKSTITSGRIFLRLCFITLNFKGSFDRISPIYLLPVSHIRVSNRFRYVSLPQSKTTPCFLRWWLC